MHCTGVSIMVPSQSRQVYTDAMQSIYDTGQMLQAEGIPTRLKWMSASNIAEIRNLFISLWYYKQAQASHLMMVDADMHFSPFMVWDMLNFDKPVTGSLYARRQFPISVVGKVFNDTDTTENMVSGHLLVEGVGAGVLIIKRDVVKEMLDKMPEILFTGSAHVLDPIIRSYDLPHLLTPFKELTTEEDVPLSEDLSFCHRWRKCGGEVWANVKHPIGHVGPFEWAVTYEQYLADKLKEKEEAAKAAAA
jgi:hypothetical protein